MIGTAFLFALRLLRLEYVSKLTIGLFRAGAIQRMAVLARMAKVPMPRSARVAFTGLRAP